MAANLLFFVRHAEREDDLTSHKTSDPKITKRGEKQAEETASFLQQMLGEHQVKEIVIECSPFLRCL
jgi:broad specificity phosphatase PhoE